MGKGMLASTRGLAELDRDGQALHHALGSAHRPSAGWAHRTQWSGQLGAGHSAAGTGAQGNKSHFARLPFDHCALSLAPFDIPVRIELAQVALTLADGHG